MLDVAAAAFAAEQDLGLLMAEDPHLVGWDENRAIAETLAVRMGVDLPLDDFFDFPLGNMFWARPSALAPLLALDSTWSDCYDSELSCEHVTRLCLAYAGSRRSARRFAE